MIRFQAEEYFEIVKELTEADFKLREWYQKNNETPDGVLTQHNRDYFLGVIRNIRKQSEEIKLDTFTEFLKRAEEEVARSASTNGDVQYFNRGMRDVLMDNVKAHVFIQIEPGKKEMYLTAMRRVSALADFDPEHKAHDLLEAHFCYALERYTACVHHLMVAVEVSLRKWAKQLGLETPRQLAVEDWEKILTAAKKKLEQLENTKRSTQRDRRIRYLAETAGHFAFIKDGWRKYSAHGREQFTESSARVVITHVEEFMRLLSSGKPKRKSVPTLKAIDLGLGQGLFALGTTGGLTAMGTPATLMGTGGAGGTGGSGSPADPPPRRLHDD